MSFAHNFSHFTGKTKTPIKVRNKKVVRVNRQHKNKYAKYSQAEKIKEARIKKSRFSNR